jgi:hypothetical protein
MQQNKHNEQHSSNHEKLINLGKCQRKPHYGGTQSEREILLALENIYQQPQYIFQPRKTTYITKLSHHKTALKIVPQSIPLYGFAENSTSKFVPATSFCTFFLYGRPPLENSAKTVSKNVSSFASIFMPKFVVVRIHTIQSVPANNTTFKTENVSLGFAP